MALAKLTKLTELLSRRSFLIISGRTCTGASNVKTPDHAAYEDRWARNQSEKYTEVEEVTDRWHYVERLLPRKVVPPPPNWEGPTPSGWRPPSREPPPLPYFVRRTRNHLLPIYIHTEVRGPRFFTRVKLVEGDIWALRNDLKEHLEKLTGKEIASQVHELGSYIGFKGCFVEEVKEWLYSKGF